MFVLNRQVVLRSIEDDAAGVMSLITNVIIGKMPEDAHNAVLRLAELTRNSAISRFNITSSFDEMIHVVVCGPRSSICHHHVDRWEQRYRGPGKRGLRESEIGLLLQNL